MTAAKKLTPQQSGRLGGLRAGQDKELCKERGRKAAETIQQRYGKEFHTRLALKRWGYRVDVPTSKASSAPVSRAVGTEGAARTATSTSRGGGELHSHATGTL
jgi:hypothetical protein